MTQARRTPAVRWRGAARAGGGRGEDAAGLRAPGPAPRGAGGARGFGSRRPNPGGKGVREHLERPLFTCGSEWRFGEGLFRQLSKFKRTQGYVEPTRTQVSRRKTPAAPKGSSPAINCVIEYRLPREGPFTIPVYDALSLDPDEPGEAAGRSRTAARGSPSRARPGPGDSVRTEPACLGPPTPEATGRPPGTASAERPRLRRPADALSARRLARVRRPSPRAPAAVSGLSSLPARPPLPCPARPALSGSLTPLPGFSWV